MLAVVVIMVAILTGCGGAGSNNGAENDGQENVAEGFDYRYATKEEGVRLLLDNEKYYGGFSRNDLEYRTQSKTGTMEEYQVFAKDQVREFTDEQKVYLDQHMKVIADKVAEKGYRLPDMDQIVFVSTTMQEECDTAAYTHGTQIYLDGAMINGYIGKSEYDSRTEYILAHELFHCMTRCDPDFRADMYKLIHFTVQEDDFKIPSSVMEYYISNPDVEHHNAYAPFEIDGTTINCFMAFITTKHFEKKGDRFFDFGSAALVPIDGTDTYYLPEQASNFNEILGANTEYVIDPEECMADNFSYLLTYDKEGPDGKGYPNPEIIEGIRDYLQK